MHLALLPVVELSSHELVVVLAGHDHLGSAVLERETRRWVPALAAVMLVVADSHWGYTSPTNSEAVAGTLVVESCSKSGS